MIEKIPVLISIVTAIIVGIISLAGGLAFAETLRNLAVAIVAAYILSSFFKIYIKNKVLTDEGEEDEKLEMHVETDSPEEFPVTAATDNDAFDDMAFDLADGRQQD